MRVVYASKRSVVKISTNVMRVISVGTQGPAAIPTTAYTDHVARTDNPHSVTLAQLGVPEGNEGQWVKFAKDGTSLVIVDPPITVMPEIPLPPDENVRADPSDPTTGFLNQKVAGLIYVDEVNHVMRVKGVISEDIPPNYYYGTNDSGQLGFWPLPSALVPASSMIGVGVGAEDEEEWMDTGELTFLPALPDQ